MDSIYKTYAAKKSFHCDFQAPRTSTQANFSRGKQLRPSQNGRARGPSDRTRGSGPGTGDGERGIPTIPPLPSHPRMGGKVSRPSTHRRRRSQQLLRGRLARAGTKTNAKWTNERRGKMERPKTPAGSARRVGQGVARGEPRAGLPETFPPAGRTPAPRSPAGN